jgi:pyruvate carboxylase
LCYTGDLTNPSKTKYSLEYYLDLAEKLVERGVHVLCVKDMAGLLKPLAVRELITALRAAHPQTPIHVHTHDTSGLGVASMVEALNSGADVVDAAVDSMSGMTSQPSMGAIVAHFASFDDEDKMFEMDSHKLNEINEYWESARLLYSPYESGQKSGSADVFNHEIPGGQYTNLYFQATSLGLASRWRDIKQTYAAANRICGDIVKVTPSSKVVGDLAQFMSQTTFLKMMFVRKHRR